MKIENTWSATSKSEHRKPSKELVNLAGRWDVGIEIVITKPQFYSHGPVEKRMITDKIP